MQELVQSRSAHLQCGDILVLSIVKIADLEMAARRSVSFATKQIEFESLNDSGDKVPRYSVLPRYRKLRSISTQ